MTSSELYKHLRNFWLFAAGMADTFNDYIYAEERPLFPAAAGFEAHMIAAPTTIIVGGGLIIWRMAIADIDLLVAALMMTFVAALLSCLIWPFGMAWINWRLFKRRHPERIQKIEYQGLAAFATPWLPKEKVI